MAMPPYSNLPFRLFQQIRKAQERNDRVYEAVVGVVTDNKDPDKLARVKVRYPPLPGQETSGWATICAFGAGDERGWFFLPEVDDEVVLMFEHGDINRPVVIGAVWNGKDKPADTNAGANERRTIVSRAGSKITFDDDGGTVSITDGGGTATLTISTENSITIETSGDIGVLAPNGDVNIVANELTAEAQQAFNIDAKSGIKLGSDAKLTIDGGSSLKVQGATSDFMPGGVQGPQGGDASPEEVPDPIDG
jgi:uncharacterized protein involved in type VI secretion and phage assembly